MKKRKWRKDRIRMQIKNKMIEKGYEIDERGRFIHRVVCRQAHGPFPLHWLVHHIDENHKNNNPENLIAVPYQVHNAVHNLLRKKIAVMDRKTIELMIQCHIKKHLTKVFEAELSNSLDNKNRSISSLYR